MPVAAVIAGGLGAAGAVGSAIIGANASKDASAAQREMAQQALAQQQKMFGVAQDALNPYINAGKSVLPTLQGLLTPGQSADTLSQMPGFQFQQKYGTMAATNALASRGLGNAAGPVARAVSDYNNGLAGTYWGNTVNALQGFAGMGASGANALAGTATTTGANMGNTMGAIGNATASGILGSANALAGGLTGATGSMSNALLLSKLLGSKAGAASPSGIYSNPSMANDAAGWNASLPVGDFVGS